MAYTPINWAENSEVDATKLDKMDNQIGTNENDLRTIQGGTASVDGRITNIEDGTSPVALAAGLTSGLENIQLNGGSGGLGSQTSTTINFGFTASVAMIIKSRGGGAVVKNTSSYSVSNADDSFGIEYYWIAIRKN